MGVPGEASLLDSRPPSVESQFLHSFLSLYFTNPLEIVVSLMD
jgi:hypothetical protein